MAARVGAREEPWTRTEAGEDGEEALRRTEVLLEDLERVRLLFDDLASTADRLLEARAALPPGSVLSASKEQSVSPHFLGAIVLDERQLQGRWLRVGLLTASMAAKSVIALISGGRA